MTDINKLIDAAAALYLAEEHAFPSKSAQKDAMGYLNHAYEELRDADRSWLLDKLNSDPATASTDPDCTARWDELEARELPFNLHQYRPAKHDTRWLSALHCEVANQLVTLREQYKRAEIIPKARSAEALLKQQEQQVAKAVKDDGFRVFGISNNFHFCQNSFGTQWFRCDWYKGGARVSFAEVSAYVIACRDVWEAAGCPDLSSASVAEIRDLYKRVA